MAPHKHKKGNNNSNHNNNNNNGNNHHNNHHNNRHNNSHNNQGNNNYQGGSKGGNSNHRNSHHNNNPNNSSNGGNRQGGRFQNQHNGQKTNPALNYYKMLNDWNNQGGAQYVPQNGAAPDPAATAQLAAAHPHGGSGFFQQPAMPYNPQPPQFRHHTNNGFNNNNGGGHNNTYFCNPLAPGPGFGSTKIFARCPWHWIMGDMVDSDGDAIMCGCNGENVPPCILNLVTKQQAELAGLRSQIDLCARYQAFMASLGY